jgi:glucokinase
VHILKKPFLKRAAVMHHNHMKILADIGGTFARFAFFENGKIEHIQKYKASEYKSFETALEIYLRESGLPRAPLLIATAAYPDASGVWRFVNENPWVIDVAALKSSGWPVEVILNDFEAATWSISGLRPEDLEALQAGAPQSGNRCLMGPGTGLGLGYLIDTANGLHVQRTHGGHMPVACLSDEQWFIAQTVRQIHKEASVPVFENFVSGPGLMHIYRAVCFAYDKPSPLKTPEELLENPDDDSVRDALMFFHEYLGIFAATAVVTGHAYGGLYLTGGVLDRLIEKDLFDPHIFLKAFLIGGVDSVKAALENTPVYHVKTPYLPLSGLIEAVHMQAARV